MSYLLKKHSDASSEKENKAWIRHVLIQYSNREKKHHKSDSGHSKQSKFNANFNANDVNKVYKLIYENASSEKSTTLLKNVNIIKGLFREDKETVDYLRTIKTRLLEDIELTLAVSIFLSVCKINFIGGQDIKGVLKNCALWLEKIITDLETARTNKTEVGIDKKIVSLISAINVLSECIGIRYRIHENEGYSISLKDLQMATDRKAHKSFYRLTKNNKNKKLELTSKSEVSMVSARSWYMEKGFDEYKDIPSDRVTENLLYALMRVRG